MDPQVAWQELIEAFHELDWDRVRDLAEGLLHWMDHGGFPPETFVIRQAADRILNERPRTLAAEWNRSVAQAACRYALDRANQVLNERDGIPHGVPFTSCCSNCGVEGPGNHDEAVDAG